MKRKSVTIILPVLFAIAAGFVVIKYNKEGKMMPATVYLLQDRKGMAANTEEWKKVQAKFEKEIKIARTNEGDIKSRLELAALFIQEARVTGNHMYYDVAAMKYVNEVLAKEPSNFEGLIYQALIYLSQHHFAEGLIIAEKARQANPDNAFIYGILTDANVELGNYKEAIADADRMVSIRPDIRSYSRISYLREIHGDIPGAIEAMELAVDAGAPGDESTEWCRIQLGRLFEYEGEFQKAEACYKTSIDNRKQYGYAFAGLGRLAINKKEYDKAIGYYMQADTLVKDYSFREEMVDIYVESGHADKAKTTVKSLLDDMNKEVKTSAADENIGHYADRELALLYVKAGDLDKALDHAMLEYKRRPGNIDVNETVAWVYYKRGEGEKAVKYLVEALKTGSKNPNLLHRAELIYAMVGNTEKSREFAKKG
jgi:tetratricopeptide (TPR) repeat protein